MGLNIVSVYMPSSPSRLPSAVDVTMAIATGGEPCCATQGIVCEGASFRLVRFVMPTAGRLELAPLLTT